MQKHYLQAQLYDAHHNQNLEDLPFWMQWAEEQDGDILELGCGTGRVLRHLAATPKTVYGIDFDAQMLAYLKTQLPSTLRKNVHLMQADFTAFHLEKRFKLILLPCNTLSTLTANAQRKALTCVRQHLSKDGIFVVSMPNPAVLAKLPEKGEPALEGTFTHPESGEPVQVSSNWACIGKTAIFYWHYDHLLENGRVMRTTLSTKHYLQSLGEIEGIYDQAGLIIIDRYGDYDRMPYSPKAPYLILSAKI
ncbi:MAG: class I SAM-dependent methyltransferase [Chloroflexota bacterium]